jgi:hypothetical protein
MLRPPHIPCKNLRLDPPTPIPTRAPLHQHPQNACPNSRTPTTAVLLLNPLVSTTTSTQLPLQIFAPPSASSTAPTPWLLQSNIAHPSSQTPTPMPTPTQRAAAEINTPPSSSLKRHRTILPSDHLDPSRLQPHPSQVLPHDAPSTQDEAVPQDVDGTANDLSPGSVSTLLATADNSIVTVASTPPTSPVAVPEKAKLSPEMSSAIDAAIARETSRHQRMISPSPTVHHRSFALPRRTLGKLFLPPNPTNASPHPSWTLSRRPFANRPKGAKLRKRHFPIRPATPTEEMPAQKKRVPMRTFPRRRMSTPTMISNPGSLLMMQIASHLSTPNQHPPLPTMTTANLFFYNLTVPHSLPESQP